MSAPGIKVTVDGEAHEVTPTAGDLVRLEREFGIAASSLTPESTRVEWVMFLAFHALRRKGIEVGTFDDFLDRADTVTGDDDSNPSTPLPLPSPL